MHHEGAFQDRFALRLTKQLEGAERQISRDALPGERRWHFGMDEDELAVRIPVIRRRDGIVVNWPLKAMLLCVFLHRTVDRYPRRRGGPDQGGRPGKDELSDADDGRPARPFPRHPAL